MKRAVKITLKYTKEELLLLFHTAITTAENVSIESMRIEENNIIFECIEGINNIMQKEQLSKLSFDSIFPQENNKSKNKWGELKKAICESLANGVICSLDDLVIELELKGIHKNKSSIRAHLIKRDELYVEVNPNLFQLKKFFKQVVC